MLKFLINHLVLVTSIFAAMLMFIPLPELALNILYILIWGYCMLLMVTLHNRTEKMLSLPRKILFLSLIIIAISISYARIILTFDMHIRMNPVTTFKFIYIINIIIAVTLLALSFHFVRKWGTKAAEASARFALDNMNQSLFDIDNKLSAGAIIEEAEQQKEKVRQDIDFFSCLDGSSRFLEGNMKALIFIYVVSIAGGCLVGVLQKSYSIQEALNIVSLPALLSTICGSMCITILASCVSYSLMNAKESQ